MLDTPRAKIIVALTLTVICVSALSGLLFFRLRVGHRHHLIPALLVQYGQVTTGLQRDIIDVYNYDVRLRTFMDASIPHYRGHVEILMSLARELDHVVMYSLGIDITSVKFMDAGVAVKRVLIDRDTGKIRIDIDGKINSTTKLQIKFKRVFSRELRGFYISSYLHSNGVKRTIATTQFEDTDARRAFPCFDEPDMKSVFQLLMVRPKRYTTLFNTKRINDSPYEWTDEPLDEKTEAYDVFKPSPKMSSYLVAFVICEFEYKEKIIIDKRVRVYSAGEYINRTQHALQLASEVLPYFMNRFQADYPIDKLDLVAIPDFAAGAMENWGLITFRMNRLIMAGHHSGDDILRNSITIAHEIAHQWFGDLVTMASWNDLWLNEGFATYFSYSALNHVYPDWNMYEVFVWRELLPAMHKDCYLTTHPIVTREQQRNTFDAISYKKGASFLRMVESEYRKAGTKHEESNAFTWGIRRYLRDNAYSAINTRDMSVSLRTGIRFRLETVAPHESLEPLIMDDWLYEKGYPVVTINGLGTDNVTASQHIFALDTGIHTTLTNTTASKFLIHLTTQTDDGTMDTVILYNESVKISVPTNLSYFKANVGFRGYFRVNYCQYWVEIISKLNKDHKVYSPAERAMFIDDIFMLKRANLLRDGWQQSLHLIDYLRTAADDNLLVWKTVIYNLGHMTRMLWHDELIFPAYKNHILTLMTKMLTSVYESTKEDQNARLLKSALMEQAVILEDNATLASCYKLFDNYRLTKATISPDMIYAVYLAVARRSDNDVEFLWQRYLITKDIGERNLLLNCLTICGNTEFIKKNLLPALLDGSIRKEDVNHVLLNMARSDDHTNTIPWYFLDTHKLILSRKYLGRVYIATAKRIYKQKDITSLLHRLNKGKDQHNYNYKYTEIVRHIQINKIWRQNNIDNLKYYLGVGERGVTK